MQKLFLTLFVLLSVVGCKGLQPTEVASPDGHIRLAFELDNQSRPSYQVWVDDMPFITPSALGFVSADSVNLCDGFKVMATDFSQKDEVWTQPWGENKSNRNHYNEMAVKLENAEKVEMTIRFRIFDDGLGFRYEYKVPGADSIRLSDELTSFQLAETGKSWSIPASFETYELNYRELPVDSVGTANTPMTWKAGGIYASLHEAALTDFPEMTLANTGGRTFKSELAPWPDGIKARFTGDKFQSPWRTLQIAREAVGLINSALILNLNEPCVLETTDWIKPMKYVGVWWGMHLGVENLGDKRPPWSYDRKRQTIH